MGKKQNLTIPGRNTKVTLEKGVTGEARQGKTGLVSVSLEGYGATLNLRERTRGSIEMRAPWLKDIVGYQSSRLSTGTKKWPEALRQASEALQVYYEVAKDHEPEETEGTRHLTLHQAIRILRKRGLIPGDPDTERGKKSRRHYERILDLAEAVYPNDPILPLRQHHVDQMYRVRTKPQDTEEEGNESRDLAPVKWPSHVTDRKPIERVGPRTVRKNLEDLRSVLRKLVGQRDDQGKLVVDADPMAGLDLGDHKAELRDVAGPKRYGLVMASADEATERMREEGIRVAERRKGSPVNTRKCLANVIPGQLRAMLAHQFHHPTRPRSWRGVRMDDVALDRGGLVTLVRGLSLREGDWRPPDDVFDLWDAGAIAYRREWSKLETERIVPIDWDFRALLEQWLAARAESLRAQGVESSWLYPSPRDPTQPISETEARLLLMKGEEVAREKLQANGHNPDELVPLFPGTKWYAYRRYWKTNRNELGWEGNRAAAYVGDWSINDGPTADTVYARLSPRMILAVVKGWTLAEALQDEETIQHAKAAASLKAIDPLTLEPKDDGPAQT